MISWAAITAVKQISLTIHGSGFSVKVFLSMILERIAAISGNLGLENDGKARQLARYVKEIGERYVDNLKW